MLGVALSSCANPAVFDSNEHWFSHPFDWTGRNGGYTFSELKDRQDRQRPVTAADLVDANGACPPGPAPAAPSPAVAAGPGAMPISPAPPSLLADGIAIGMTECDVVYRAGAPSSVQLGRNATGDRTAILTYNSGPRPGIYRFDGGRLRDMDRVESAASAPQTAKRVVKKKSEPVAAERVSTE